MCCVVVCLVSVDNRYENTHSVVYAPRRNPPPFINLQSARIIRRGKEEERKLGFLLFFLSGRAKFEYILIFKACSSRVFTSAKHVTLSLLLVSSKDEEVEHILYNMYVKKW